MENLTNENNVKSEVWKAYLFSGLIMLAGAIIWGVCYGMGFFSSWIACVSAALAALIFIKFHSNINWKVWIWVIVLTIVLNLIALILSIGITIASSVGVGLGEAFAYFVEAIKSGSSEVVTAFLLDIVYTIFFSVLGAALGVKLQKSKKTNDEIAKMNKAYEELKANEGNNVAPETTGENVNVDHVAILDEIQEIVKVYMQTHDKETFNAAVEAFKQKCRNELTVEQIDLLKHRASVIRSKDNSSTPERAVACDIIAQI